MSRMNIWFPEGLYLSSLGHSSMLLTSALFFYHIVRVRSIDIPSRPAAFFSIGFLIISISIVIVGLSVYHKRIQIIGTSDLSAQQRRIYKEERRHWIIYLVIGIVYVLLIIAVGVSIWAGIITSIPKRRGGHHPFL